MEDRASGVHGHAQHATCTASAQQLRGDSPNLHRSHRSLAMQK